MRKNIGIILINVLAAMILIVIYLQLNNQDNFTCESQYTIVEHVNDNQFRSEGVLDVELSKNSLFLSLDGMLINGNKKRILSRSIDINIEQYNNSSTLFYVKSLKNIQHNSDDIPDDVIQQLLFGEDSHEKIIYINRLTSDTILLGNPMFPKYGCKRK